MNTEQVDVAVVGAGVIGLCTALELAEAGRTVTVISADPPATGASAGNAGMLVPSHVVPLSAPGVIAQGLRWMMKREAPFHIKLRPNTSLIRWLLLFRKHCTPAHVQYAAPHLLDLNLASMRGFERLAAEADDFGYGPTGLMMVWRDERLGQGILHEADVAEEVGLRIERLDQAALFAKEPNLKSEAQGAVFYEQDGRVNPGLFMQSLERRIRALGGRLHFGQPVKSVEPGSVRSEGIAINAREVVVAAGAWTPRLTSRRLPIQPAKGYSVTMDAPATCPAIPMILMDDRVTITPMPGKLRFGGTLSLSGFDPSVDPVRVRPILRQAARYAPDLDVSQLPVWSGYRPASPDGLPVIGSVQKGVWVASGHGMMGLSLAPGTGRLLADLILDRAPVIDSGPFDPKRFF